MKSNELIAYAMEHYTEGCEYTNFGYIKDRIFVFKNRPNSYININGNIDAGTDNGYFYYNGKWATILKKGVQPNWSAIAKIKYPIGCKVKCARTGTEFILEDDVFVYGIIGENSINGGCNKGYLRANGKWAEIITYPDEKLDNFEVGKWYRSIGSNGWKKFLKKDNNKWFYSEEIYRYSYNKDFELRTNCNDFVRLPFKFQLLRDLTEIQEYLPDEHVDKIKNISKIPEYVKCIKSLSSSYKLDKIYRVNQESKKVIGENDFYATWDNTNTYQSKFELSTKEAYDNYSDMVDKYPLVEDFSEIPALVSHNNLIKILYTKSSKKNVLSKKSKKLKFINVNQIKIN